MPLAKEDRGGSRRAVNQIRARCDAITRGVVLPAESLPPIDREGASIDREESDIARARVAIHLERTSTDLERIPIDLERTPTDRARTSRA